MSKHAGLCSVCNDWTYLNGGVCEDCTDALLNPISPKVQALSLDDEVGRTFRGLAQRHSPELLGNDVSIRKLQVGDHVDEGEEKMHPLQVVLSMEELQKLCSAWVEGPGVPVPPED